MRAAEGGVERYTVAFVYGEGNLRWQQEVPPVTERRPAGCGAPAGCQRAREAARGGERMRGMVLW